MLLAELLTLPEPQLRALFGDLVYRRGLDYQQQGRVSQVEFFEDLGEDGGIVGLVQGGGRRPYQVEIATGSGRRGELLSDCSCPVGSDRCKHAAALLIEARVMLERVLARSQGDPLEGWLAGAEALTEVPVAPLEHPGKEQLHYVLTLREHYGQEYLCLDAIRSKPLKRGGLGKGQAVSLERVAGRGGYAFGWDYAPRPNYVTPQDEAIAHLALALDLDLFLDTTSFSGDAAVVLLRRLLATGRCHFESHQGLVLREGGPRALSFDWCETGAGRRRLEAHLAGLERWLLLPTEPLWYLDPQNGGCGPTQSDLPPALVGHLGRLPELDDEAQVRFSEAMQGRLPASFPLPSQVEVERIEQPLRPQLRLFGVDNPAGQRLPLAELGFGYGEHTLPMSAEGPQAQSRLRHAGRTLLITRDIAAEMAAVERLLDLHLCSAEGGAVGLPGRSIFIPAWDAEAPSRLDLRIWAGLIAALPSLEAAGWQIRHDEQAPPMSLHPVEAISGQLQSRDGDNDWFEVGLNIEVDGKTLPLLPLIAQLLAKGVALHTELPLVVEIAPGQWVTLAQTQVRPLLDALLELYDAPLGEGGTLRLPRTRAGVVEQLEESLGVGRLDTRQASAIRELGHKLRHFDGIAAVPAPVGLRAELRPYQQRGLDWLAFLRDYGLGGLLADDMGLGKTLQTLALLLHEKEAGRLDRPALVVCPTSLLGNWRREAERFAPALKVLEWHGPQRSRELSELAAHDLVITNYPLLARDGEFLAALELHYLICDEAQQLKNPRALASQAARNLQTRHRLALTGTPLENHLGELWALFDLVMPGFLWDERRFNQLLRHPIEKLGDAERRAQLAQRVSPFMLRRTKGEVASELPPKSEIIRLVELGPDQRRLYETIRVAMADKVQKLLAEKGLQRARIEILDALLKLRQVCCDPQLVKTASARKVQESAKLELLMEMLPELLEEGRRILLFSQFTSMLGLIEARLGKAGIAYTKLTGQTRRRQEAIERFTSGEVALFLISLKAGGTGLNLTEADTVIHYDPWWNPAVEAQATDRAHRIGQDKPVFVYKLLAEATLEEKILAMQQRKQALADAVYAKGEGQDAFALDASALSELFAQ